MSLATREVKETKEVTLFYVSKPIKGHKKIKVPSPDHLEGSRPVLTNENIIIESRKEVSSDEFKQAHITSGKILFYETEAQALKQAHAFALNSGMQAGRGVGALTLALNSSYLVFKVTVDELCFQEAPREIIKCWNDSVSVIAIDAAKIKKIHYANFYNKKRIYPDLVMQSYQLCWDETKGTLQVKACAVLNKCKDAKKLITQIKAADDQIVFFNLVYEEFIKEGLKEGYKNILEVIVDNLNIRFFVTAKELQNVLPSLNGPGRNSIFRTICDYASELQPPRYFHLGLD